MLLFRSLQSAVFGKPSAAPKQAHQVNESIESDDMDFEMVNAATVPSQEDLTKDLVPFAWTEHLAHTSEVAYGAPKRDPKVPYVDIVEENNQINQYRVRKIEANDSGLIGETLRPTKPSHTQPNTLYVSFTGTHSTGTALADLQHSAGEESFRQAELNAFLKQVNKEVGELATQTGQKVNIVFSGHSLGGAYAQLAYNSVQRAVAANLDERNPSKTLKAIQQQFVAELNSNVAHTRQGIPQKYRDALTPTHVASMTLGVWNPAGVLKAVENNSNALAAPLQNAGVKQRALYGYVAGDVVQQTGQGNVLSCVNANSADVRFLKIDTGKEGIFQAKSRNPFAALRGFLGAVSAHTSKHFNRTALSREFPQLKYTYLQNNSVEGQSEIRRELGIKAAILNYTRVQQVQANLYNGLTGAAPLLHSKPIQDIQTCVSNGLSIASRVQTKAQTAFDKCIGQYKSWTGARTPTRSAPKHRR